MNKGATRNENFVLKRCTEAEESAIYQAFMIGFSDYLIKMEMSQQDFFRRFFGPEGNSKEHSFIAFSENEPVGVILGGVKVFEGIKTMRCGTLAVHPSFRGAGISQQLFELHKQEAIKQGCQQLFLEVIVGNDRAIHFYKKLGYEKIYDLHYFSLENPSSLQEVDLNAAFSMKKIDFQQFQQVVQHWNYHINWQNDLDYVKQLLNIVYYAAIYDDKIVGTIALNPNGNIHFLMVEKDYRNQGIGSSLIKAATKEINVAKLSAGFPNNSLLEGFLRKLHFQKGQLAQFEMYLTL